MAGNKKIQTSSQHDFRAQKSPLGHSISLMTPCLHGGRDRSPILAQFILVLSVQQHPNVLLRIGRGSHEGFLSHRHMSQPELK